jgi:zinc resistance-associated protein
MKKQIVALALISSLTMVAAASADWGKGGGGKGGCAQMQGQYQQLDQATKDKLQQFAKDNQESRKEIAMKRAEMRALMSNDNPDPQLAAKIAGELFDLRNTMRQKAEAAGLEQYIGPGHMGDGPGRGQGEGKCSGRGQD